MSGEQMPPINRFVAALPEPVSRSVAPQLEPMTFRRGLVLGRAGAPLDQLYFPDRGMVSLVKAMQDGRTVEVGAVGIEGVVGVASLLGMEETAFETIVQVEGSGWCLKAPILRSAMEHSPALKQLVLRYMYYTVNRLAQTAACNRLHTVRERCCRWLLTAHDSAHASTFTLTHEFLALMMGVNRPWLTLTVRGLQRQGIIAYQRASISIRDRRALEEGSCECYETLRQKCDKVYGPQTRRV